MTVKKVKISKKKLKDRCLYLFDEDGNLVQYKIDDHNEVTEEKVKPDTEETEIVK